MNARSIPPLCRLASRSLIALAIALSMNSTGLLADEWMTTCNYADKLCGWTVDDDQQNAQHDVRQDDPQPAVPVVVDTAVGRSVTTIAAAVGASTGVSLQQILEPFALVGPYIENPLQMVDVLNQWWESAAALAETLQRNETDAAIGQIATMEPIDVEPIDVELVDVELVDVEGYGPSVLVAEESILTPGVEVTPIDGLVGSSPMIVTINEPYMPYDLSVADLRLRSVFPLSTKPFCVRSRAAQWSPAPMWTEVDQILVERRDEKKVERAIGPVDCWMEDWPEPIAEPSISGVALLSRAGATTGLGPDNAPIAQIAEVVSDAVIR